MELQRKLFTSAVKFAGVAANQLRVIASNATQDRVSDVLEPFGCVLTNYRRNPIVLAQHDSDQPIARCSFVGVVGEDIQATIDFPAPGVSARSDEYLALAKAGVISAVSVGFMPLPGGYERISGGGLRYTKWELLELSLVSVGANPSALVVERRYGGRTAAHAIEREARARAARIIETVNLRASLELGLPFDIGTVASLKSRPPSQPMSRTARLAEVAAFKRKLAALTE